MFSKYSKTEQDSGNIVQKKIKKPLKLYYNNPT